MNTAKLTEEGLKSKAKKIRQFIQEKYDLKIKHGHCLDLVSIIHGFKDWNTASAKLSQIPAKPKKGERINSLGKFREQTSYLPDDTVLDASFDLEIGEFLSELEDFQTGAYLECSMTLNDHGSEEYPYATLELNIEHESADFDSSKIESVQHSMARYLGIELKH